MFFRMVLLFSQAFFSFFSLLNPQAQWEVIYGPLRIGEYLEQRWKEAHPSYRVVFVRAEGKEEAQAEENETE